MQWLVGLMNDPEKPWNLKHQRVDLVSVLQRPVETTTESGRSGNNNDRMLATQSRRLELYSQVDYF